MNLAVICCLHGNEPYGLEVLKRLPVSVRSFIGNPEAISKNVRFVDCDLNRNFPGKENGNKEEKIANKLKNELTNFDYVIDLHSSSNDCPLFGIITRPNNEKIELAKRLGLKRLVIMPELIDSGKSLICHVKCGIALEIGPHARKENVTDVIKLIQNLLNNAQMNEAIEIFEVFDIVKRKETQIAIKNFQDIKKGDILTTGESIQKADFDFTAVLVNESAYGDTLCLAARRFSAQCL